MTANLVLASASPRRLELLKQIGVDCEVDPADIDESLLQGEPPADYVQRMARSKAERVYSRRQPLPVLAADTTVVLDGDVLGKPCDRMDGLAMLARLSGRVHHVMTAVCLQSPSGIVEQLVVTEVEFVQLGRDDCEAYLDTTEPWDKAGGYAIQGLAGAFVAGIKGSYSNVVGLPLSQTWRILRDHGVVTGLVPRVD
jgi:septum formation protein